MLFTKQGLRDGLRKVISLTFWFDECWPASRKYFLSLLLISVICAKCLHIYSHLNSLPLGQLMIWGPTFFVQDILCILLVHSLCANFQSRWARIPAALVVVPLRYDVNSRISGMFANISIVWQSLGYQRPIYHSTSLPEPRSIGAKHTTSTATQPPSKHY